MWKKLFFTIWFKEKNWPLGEITPLQKYKLFRMLEKWFLYDDIYGRNYTVYYSKYHLDKNINYFVRWKNYCFIMTFMEENRPFINIYHLYINKNYFNLLFVFYKCGWNIIYKAKHLFSFNITKSKKSMQYLNTGK